MEKEPLSIIAVKILLAVIIFTGVGTIIVGGGWLIGDHYENKTSDRMAKQVNQKIGECVEEGEKFYLKPGEPQTKECCHGLKTGSFYSMIDDKCFPETTTSICIDCPNGVCGLGENKCNCPEDCGDEDETADQKTYQNKKYGFEVKYPQSFYVEEGDYNIGDQYRKLWIQLADSKWKNQGVHNPSLIIDLIETNLSAKEYLNKTGSSGSMLDETCLAESIYCSVKDVKDISVGIDEISALQFYSAAVSGSDYHTIVKNNDFLIDIRRHSSGIGDFPEDTYNQILSTFKFIDQDETADWQTYRNEDYGFEVSCPRNLIVRERQHGDVESFVVGFIQKGGQANLVSIEKYNKLEDFSNLLAVKKYYKKNDYYLVTFGFLENTLADQILSTFKFIEKDETADWEIYRNEEYGFEVKYPSNYKVGPRKNLIKLEPDDYSKYCLITIGQRPSFKNVLFADWHQKNMVGNQDLSIKEENKNQMVKTVEADGIQTLTNYTYFTNEEIAIYLNCNKDKDNSIYDQIVSTFKFIEE